MTGEKASGEEIACYLLRKLKGRAEDVIVAAEKREKAQVKFSNNKVSTTQRWLTESVFVFAAIKGRIVSTTISAGRKSADAAVKKLISFSGSVSKNTAYRGIAKGPFTYKKVQAFDKKLVDIDMADKVHASINAALECGAKRASGVFETSASRLYLATSNSVEGNDISAKAYFSIRAMAEGGGSGHEVIAARKVAGLGCDKAAAMAAKTAVDARQAVSASQGTYDVLLDFLPAANLMEHVASSASVFYVESGLSFLGNKLGKGVASRSLTLVDDATIDWGIGSRVFDDEGVPTQRNEIIKEGKLKTYLHNTSTAARYRTGTTANAGLISPKAINPVVEKGNLNKEAMLSKIKKGLLVTNVWYTRFTNHATGDFSTIPRDGMFLVERGKVKRPVKGLRISDNLLGMLKRVDAVGSESREIMSWELESHITVPQLLVRKVNVTKSDKNQDRKG
ncbi:TldD/PmbA family protein [Candidatus Woesearchaeota archaeon]|nr:TldD/PmbA family protein [Candidatus Woesearchaeota archaeon]